MPDHEKTGVVIIDHGSRRAESNELLHDVARLYAESQGVEIAEPAHMELAEPTLAQAFARCVARGARHVVVAQFFLGPGRHSREDIPRLAAQAAAAHPGVTWSVTGPLGVDRRLAELLHQRVLEALEAQP